MTENFDNLYNEREGWNTKAIAEGLDESLTPFADLTVVDRQSVLDISSDEPLSEQKDIWTTGVSHDSANSRYQITANNSTESIETVKNISYVPGYNLETGISLRIPNAPNSNQEVKWGYWNGSDGIYWGYDDTGLYLEFQRNGTAQGKIRESEWNGDDIDPASILAEGAVSRLQLSLYNYGEVGSELFPRMSDTNRQVRKVAHRLAPRNETTLSQQNLPLRVEVVNNEASDFTVNVADRQVALRGEFTANRRPKGDFRTGVSLSGTDWVPLISFRKKADRVPTQVDIFGYTVTPSDDIILQLRSDCDLGTDVSFSSPQLVDSSETAIETSLHDGANDQSADETTGNLRWGPDTEQGGQGGRSGFGDTEGIDLDMKRDRPMTLFARRVTGTSGTISACTVRWEERW